MSAKIPERTTYVTIGETTKPEGRIYATPLSSKMIFVDMEAIMLVWLTKMQERRLEARSRGVRVFYDLEPGGRFGRMIE